MQVFVLAAIFIFSQVAGSRDPYAAVPTSQRDLVKSQIERWTKDQIRHDWQDLWLIQEQTSDLKNEVLFDRNAPDMSRAQFVQAMKQTIGSGYPDIKAFRLIDIESHDGHFRVIGCAKEERETWHQTRIADVWFNVADGKILFGLHSGGSEPCNL